MAGYKTNRVEIKEQDYLSEEQKRRAREEERKAAERSAALEKGIEELDVKEFFNERTDPVKKVPEYEPKLFGEGDREEENGYPGFGKSFLEILKEEKAAEQARSNKEKDLPGYRPEEREESKYLLSPTVRASIQRSENMYNAYKSGEEWLMSDEGGDDLVKGFINNFRSAIGTGVEDFAFWLTENAPWYKPAQNVVEKNTAGKIAETAQNQFGNAKANGINGKVVDFLDNTSKNLGYSLFGFKAGDYAQGIGEGFDTYRNFREQGYSKEEAARISLGKTSLAILSTKADDYIGKNNKVDDVLYVSSGIKRKVDSSKTKTYNGIKLDKKEYARLSTAVGTYKPMERGKMSQILDNENGDPAYIYDVFVDMDGKMVVLNKYAAQNIHEKENLYDDYKK